jgi:hypothetical protein
MFARRDSISSLTNLGAIMSKQIFIDVVCEKCLKTRKADKWMHGKYCRKCATKESGALRRGILRPRKQDLTGRVFGQLTAIKPSITKGKSAGWICRCTCGKEINVATCKLLYAGQHSCGCHKVTQGGYAGTRTYKSWSCMVRRCTLKSSNRWHIYGGRGIKVCEAWKDSFLSFLKDMGDRPLGTSLDRIDSDGDYCKENCRWSGQKEQQNNRRDNFLITAFGKTMTLAEWVKETGIKRQTIVWRIVKSSLSPEEALTRRVSGKRSIET